MTRLDLTHKLLILEKERDELREENVKLRNKLLELANQCQSCDGVGVVTVMVPRPLYRGVVVSREEPCGDCHDIRELLS